jgi:uncharacterized protein (DUF2249 family)
MTTTLIDARAVPPLDRHALIFSTFDALQPGQAFDLVNNHDPSPLYDQFQKARRGQFEWQYVMEGPGRWQVRIAKAVVAAMAHAAPEAKLSLS